MVSNDGICNFRLVAAESPVEWYYLGLKNFTLNNGGTMISENPFVFETKSSDGKYTFTGKVSGFMCDDKSYFSVVSCLKGSYDEDAAKKIFDSMSCEKNWSVKHRENKRLGIVITPGAEKTYKTFAESYNLARNSGAEMTHNYVVWGEVENAGGNYNWNIQDFIMGFARNKGLEASVVFNIIHTSVIGELPDDLKFTSFNDTGLVSRYTKFLLSYIDRYKDVVKYVEIGNEVNIYLEANPDEIDAFASLYKQVYDAIKQKYPDVKVGTVFAYHEMKDKSGFKAYEKLKIGDFDAFTLYIYDEGFMFDRDPMEIFHYLKEIQTLTGSRHFAMEEVGWNTESRIKGTQEDQIKTVDYFFDFLKDAPDRLEFMQWFMLHDDEKENCGITGKTFFLPNSPILENKKAMDPFIDFICYLGLLDENSVPKLAWHEWVNKARGYN